MKIASWNVNSIKARLPNVLAWLDENPVDMLLMQELKCTDDDFPQMEFRERGYHIYTNGQKTYNGVAILSRFEGQNITKQFRPDTHHAEDAEARFIAGEFDGVFVACLYLPNGNMDDARYQGKLAWMEDFNAYCAEKLKDDKACVFGGDYNVIPTPEDCYDIQDWQNDALYRLDVRRKFRTLLNMGYVDAFRAVNNTPHQYTFWDYQKGRWPKNEGIRIDHFILSPQAADRMKDCVIDSKPRGQEKASDHTPIILEFSA